MNRRRSLLAAAILLALLTLLMAPLARMMTEGRDESSAKDAEHMIKPMLELLKQSPQTTANTPVEPMMEIEDVWAIEDTREESGGNALVTGMRSGDNELGFDAESNTFYCTLGMGEGDDWPELSLFAKPAEGKENLRVAWIDDYTYDWRSEAIAEGYRYELLVYTDTEYAYFGLVFTGLPVVTLHVDGGREAIGDEYVPARMSVSSAEYDAVSSGIWIHLRGGGYDKGNDKYSYRVEFHEQSSGRDKKAEVSLLGMEADTDWLLISNNSDETGGMRNHLCWELWNMWNPDGNALMLLGSRMVEVFVDDEYRGMYQLMQRVDPEKEIERLGGDSRTDYTYRIIRNIGIEERPVHFGGGRWYELRHKPQSTGEEQQFDKILNYIEMNTWVNEETLRELVGEWIDMPALMNYFAFMQAADLGYENVDNNLYIYALRQSDGRYHYYLAPWDMDNGLPGGQGTPEEAAGMNLMMRMPYRILNLNLQDSRRIYYEIWNEKRATILSDDALYQWFEYWESYINRSGAYARESEKWWGGASTLSLQLFSNNMISSMSVLDRQMYDLWPYGDRDE